MIQPLFSLQNRASETGTSCSRSPSAVAGYARCIVKSARVMRTSEAGIPFDDTIGTAGVAASDRPNPELCSIQYFAGPCSPERLAHMGHTPYVRAIVVRIVGGVRYSISLGNYLNAV